MTGPSLGMASFNASSHTTSPLEALMKNAPGCISEKKCLSAIPRVVSLSGVCIVTICEFSRRYSRSQKPNGPSASARGGSHLRILKPKAKPILSINEPTCPTPTIPIVSPSKLIALREASPYNAEKTYSITPPALQPGAFLTVIPWASQ